jgi:hypothetical protein
VASAAERDVLRLNPDLMQNGFALSYYVLEKGLPLTYFMQPLPAYRKYLASDPPSLLEGEAFQFLRDSLGAIVRIEITLLEGLERSPRGTTRLWTEKPATLRPFVETCIHPLAVVRTLLPQQAPEWTTVTTGVYAPRRREVGEIAPTFVRAYGRIGATELMMMVGKHVNDPSPRHATIEHQRGMLVADFDARRLEIIVDGNVEGTIMVSHEWAANYAVQLDLIRGFLLRGHGSVRYDDFARQLDALDWWDSLCDWAERHDVVPFDYDDSTDIATESSPGTIDESAR